MSRRINYTYTNVSTPFTDGGSVTPSPTGEETIITKEGAGETAGPTSNEHQNVDIPEDILIALGDKPKNGDQSGLVIHKEIAERWEIYLKKGLTVEQKQKLIDTHLPPLNCPLLKPPTLNAEIEAALKSPLVKQDKFLGQIQKLLAAGLSALSMPVNEIAVETNKKFDVKTEFLPPLIDAVKAIASVYQSISMHRRYLIMPSLNESYRKIVQDSPIDEHLFGANLQENLKISKAVKRTGQELSMQVAKKKRIYGPSGYQNPQPSTSKQHQNFRKTASTYTNRFRTNQKPEYHKKKKEEEQKRWRR